MARAWDLDDPPCPPGGGGRAARDLDVRRGGAAAQPSDDRRVSREWVSCRASLSPGRARDRTADVTIGRGSRAVPAAGTDRGGGRRAQLPRAALGGGDRRVSPPGNDRRG